METRKMLSRLAKRFPKRIAKLNHDYVGLMNGKLPNEVHKILLCLDCDDALFDRIKEEKPDLVISHHPFIFGTKAKVFKYDLAKKELCEKLDALNIPVYSMHTNFDTGCGGMNDALAIALGLKDIYAPIKDPMMRIGTLDKEMNIKEFATKAKNTFGVSYSLLVNSGSQMVQKVGIIGGGGSRRWALAKDEGCDIFISGDAPHYVRRDIVNAKYNYLDMPHEIEKIFIPTMKKLLLEMDETLQIIEVDHEILPSII